MHPARRPSTHASVGCCAAALVLASLGALPARAADIVVDGACTLADAIHAANRDLPAGSCPPGAGADTLFLTQDVVLTEVDNEDGGDGPNGLPILTSEITIEGGGHTIRRESESPEFRILYVEQGAVVQLTDLTVSGGFGNLGVLQGAGIYTAGTLTLTRTTVSGNEVAFFGEGAGILATGEDVLTVNESLVTNNVGAGLQSSDSGSGNGAQLIVEDSQLTHNTRSGLFAGASAGKTFITNSTISDNGSGAAGAYGNLYIYDSVMSDNEGDGFSFGFGIGFARVSGSLISGNERGVFTQETTSLILTNTTISGNTTGVFLGYDGSISLKFSTISSHTGEEPVITGDANGSNFTVEGTIIGNNAGVNCFWGAVVDQGGNLDDDGTCVDDDGPGFGELTGLDAELRDNGGPTATHALLPGSTAIDAGGACELEVDQRGFPRDDGACDSGAYEAQEEPLPLTVSGICPGDLTLMVSGATPAEGVTFVGGVAEGETEIPGRPCPGLVLGMEGIRRLTTRAADAGGVVTLTRSVNPNHCGQFLQAIDLATCALSNVAEIQ